MRCIIPAFPLSREPVHWLLNDLAQPTKLHSGSAVGLRQRSIKDQPRSRITLHQSLLSLSHKGRPFSPVSSECISFLPAKISQPGISALSRIAYQDTTSSTLYQDLPSKSSHQHHLPCCHPGIGMPTRIHSLRRQSPQPLGSVAKRPATPSLIGR
ncbi:hypothetical protein BDZ45DRAFT_185318 [Acephala macrosclerotiorum]|nr:hypothetical protein BDZ45DRAFT_185318 [Acephala macrosclerotiorum]